MENLAYEHDYGLGGLSFLWLELTNRCNLECTHCYTDSAPMRVDEKPISKEGYFDLLSDAYAAGCRKVQFIGGEPTLNKILPDLLERARTLGYDYIEIYSNMTHVGTELFDQVSNTGSRLATSVYSDDPATHDQITNRKGSHSKTEQNIREAIRRGIPVRVGFVEMPENRGHATRTANWIASLGEIAFHHDVLRKFGRGDEVDSQSAGLCGNCWKGSLCVSPSGEISPCIMSKSYNLGNVLGHRLSEVAFSGKTLNVRELLSSPLIYRS
jgi:MoaA/NifB/PqqE/SkfB family radical SAM enzyme